jgi:HAE1 family hydrophobic/amphiphilic exporter-1
MYAFNFSINNLTLMALTLSVGFVVDDAIVMLENIVRHIEAACGRSRRRSRFARGRLHHHFDHYFVDRGLHSGAVDGRMVGRVFREFAVTITATIHFRASFR